jgi:hypothetical protein
MNNVQGIIFLILIILIIIAIISIKFMYDVWATSVTINLLKNNSGILSGKRLIIWFIIIGIIALILNFLGKQQQTVRH